MYHRRVWLFHRNHPKRIFEFHSEKEEELKKAEGWVESPADAREPIREVTEEKPPEKEKVKRIYHRSTKKKVVRSKKK